ncbi:MAG TPA: SPOR domain-containing protein [Steroidobacteraceae bacterium]
MKERLTGAIILVVLIVLLVPELLSGPSRPEPAAQAAAPSPSSSEDPPLRSYTIDLADESHSAAPSAGTTSNAPPQASGPAQPSTLIEHPAQVERPAQDASTVQQSPAAAAPTEASPPESPEPAQATSPAAPAPKESTRPAPVVPSHQSRPPAERPSSSPHLAAAPKHPVPAAERAGTGEKSATGGWVVQVGVFAKQANAQRLVRELQEQGFRTQLSENTSSGRTLWWVRTAPVAERGAAEQLSARLRAAGHVGSVVPK